jgi:hypothetical protein
VLLKERLDRFPAEVAVGGPGKAGRWVRDRDLFACRGPAPEGLGAEPAGELPGEGIALARAAPGAAAPEAGLTAVSAVYRAGEGGPVGVPTGQVFVRFAAGAAAEAQRQRLLEAGYEITEVPVYAPHAAWLKARSGDPADALRGLGRLTALPGVEHVEPQILSARAWK